MWEGGRETDGGNCGPESAGVSRRDHCARGGPADAHTSRPLQAAARARDERWAPPGAASAVRPRVCASRTHCGSIATLGAGDDSLRAPTVNGRRGRFVRALPRA